MESQPYSKHKNELLITLSHAVADSNKISDKLANIFEKWIEQVKEDKATDIDLKTWLRNQANYFQPKDREYAAYLESLANGGN